MPSTRAANAGRRPYHSPAEVDRSAREAVLGSRGLPTALPLEPPPVLLDPVRDRLRAALAAGPRLRLAVLFGSRATGRARDGSDFDIGILPVDPDLSLHDELTLASALSEAVGAEVDVVRLDGDAPQLGAEVARTGICLLEAAPGVFAAYRANAISVWLDFEETIAPHRAHFLRRLAARVG